MLLTVLEVLADQDQQGLLDAGRRMASELLVSGSSQGNRPTEVLRGVVDGHSQQALELGVQLGVGVRVEPQLPLDRLERNQHRGGIQSGLGGQGAVTMKADDAGTGREALAQCAL
nr:hypothetical protein [Halomonas elongata]